MPSRDRLRAQLTVRPIASIVKITLVAVSLVMLNAASAFASGTVSTSGSTLTFAAGSGDANITTVSLSGSTYTITDTGATLSAGSGCTAVDSVTATCSVTGITLVAITGSDGNDAVKSTSSTPATIDGGSGDDTLAGGAGNDTLNGGSGSDTLDYSTAGAAVTVFLYQYTAQNTVNAGTDTITYVEGLIGTPYNDTLKGSSTNDTITAGGGNDFITPGTGTDVVSGGAGSDAIDYSARTASVNVTLDGVDDDGETNEHDNIGTDVENIEGGSAGDTLIGNASDEYIHGNGGNDTIKGGAGNDEVTGYDGDDLISGQAGDDTHYGGNGVDTVDYSDAPSAVTIWLYTTSAQNTGGAGTDIISSTENAIGSGYNDTIVGSTGANTISGGAGNDALTPNTGVDVVNGGTGTDTASYYSYTAAVDVTLDGTANDGTSGEGDNVATDVESITGGSGNDTLTGSSVANTLSGGDGNDIFYAGAGNDTMNGGEGTDVMFGDDGDDTFGGGNGTDTADYSHAGSAVTVALITSGYQNTVGAGSDNLSTMENLVGSSYNDTLGGSDSANTIHGGDGNDVIKGRLGADDMWGDAGTTDRVEYTERTTDITMVIGDGVANDGAPSEGDHVHGDIEDVSTGSGNDNITGSSDSNNIITNSGTDTLQGMGGSDTLNGGAGTDLVDYSAAPSAVTVSLAIVSSQNTGGAGWDALSAIENLTGSNYDDALNGDGTANVLAALNGNDLIQPGLGADTLWGGSGTDTATYWPRTATVTASLDNTANDGESGEGDFIKSDIENITGGSGDDTFTGDSSANVLIANGGNDTILGGDGDDWLEGDNGSDTVSYAGAGSAVTATLLSTSAQNTVGADTDTISTVENLTGSSYNDTLSGSDAANTIHGGDGNDSIRGRLGADDMWGDAGTTDRVEYTERTTDISMVIGDGVASDGAPTEGDHVHGDIEDVSTGSGNDNITGSSDSNNIITNSGTDTLQGMGGSDTLNGGGGTDLAEYTAAPSSVAASLAITSSQNTGGGGWDTFASIEDLTGSNYDDTLNGDANANALTGLNGNDLIQPGLGADTLWGGGGTDTATYWPRTATVTASLDNTANDGESGEGDFIKSDVESITGGSGDDTLTGDSNGNVLIANGGNDTLTGGDGNDSLEGGNGTDTVSYAGAGSAVTATLASTSAQNTGGAGTDTFTTVENLTGSRFADVLTGNTSGNSVDGGSGNDTINAGSGNDTLTGGRGYDTVNAAAGDDSVLVRDKYADNVNCGDGADTAKSDATDILTACETLLVPQPASITSGPAEGSTLAIDSAVFLFTSSDAVSYECRMDNDAFATCSSPFSMTGLSDGVHHFQVRARAPLGEVDLAPATRNFFVDADEPETTIIAGPANSAVVNSSSASVDFVSGQGARFECSIDGASYSSCAPPRELHALSDGSHTFSVRAVDAAGNVDSTPASRTFSVQTATAAEGASRLSIGEHAIDFVAAAGVLNDVNVSSDSGFLIVEDTAAPITVGLGCASTSPTVAMCPIADVEQLSVDLRDQADVAVLDSPVETQLSGGSGNDVLHGGAEVDRISAGSGNDVVEGFAGDDTIDGGSGDDSIDAGSGSDDITGGDGDDWVSYASRSAMVNVNLDAVADDGESGEQDSVGTGIENIRGGSGADALTGNDVSNKFNGGLGADSFAGGGGADTVSYADRTAAVNVAIDNVANDGATGEGDNVKSSVENLIGGSNNDSLEGSAGSNTIDGGLGADELATGGGLDTVSYDGRTASVTADNDGQADDGTVGEGDTIAVEFSSIRGGSGNDKLTIDGQDVGVGTLHGGFGDDKLSVVGLGIGLLYGGPGNDTVLGSSNSDTLEGESGNDYISGSGGYDVLAGGSGDDLLSMRNGESDYGVCGSGEDSVSADTYDTALYCEHQDIPAKVGSYDGGYFSYQGSGFGTASNITITPVGDQIILTDSLNEIEADQGCALVTIHEVSCDGADVLTAYLSLGPGDDDLSSGLDVDTTVNAGSGNDSIAIGGGDNTVDAGEGDDTVASEEGHDHIDGGTGDDSLTGGDGVDTLLGDAGNDSLNGGNGNDVLVGGSGSDIADAGAGNDFVNARDETHDEIDCGADADTTVSDSTDAHSHCETLQVAPDTSLLTAPASLSTTNLVEWRFTSSDASNLGIASGSFECSLDGAVFSTCVSPVVSSPLSPGAHTFRVRAVDVNGNTDATAAAATFTVIGHYFSTTIDTRPGAETNDSTPAFTFSASDPDATFECSIDHAAFSACASPLTTSSLGAGNHSFAVRGLVPNYTDWNPAEWDFQIEYSPPQTTLTSGPDNPTSDNTPEFEFESSEESGGFQCAIDANDFAACGSPFTSAGLPNGSHTFRVKAIDGAGNADSTPAIQEFEVSTSAPETQIDAVPEAPVNDPTPTIVFSSPTTDATFECKLDGGAYVACVSPFTTPGLSNASHTVLVRAIDAAGTPDASPATATLFVDAEPPETEITESPSSPVTVATPTFGFSTGDSGSTFECQIDEGAFVECANPFTTEELDDDSHTFRVRAIDAFGTEDGTPATYTFELTAHEPETTITSFPADWSQDNTPEFVFESGSIGTSFWCRVDENAFEACESPFVSSALADGEHSFEVFATNAAYLSDSTPDSVGFTIDTVAPEVTVIDAPGGTTSLDTPTVEFISDDTDASFECSVDSAAFDACESLFVADSLDDGSHSISVRATDEAGNVSDAEISAFLVDSEAVEPETTLISGPATVTNSKVSTFEFSSPDPGASFVCRFDSEPWNVCESPLEDDRSSEDDEAHHFKVRSIVDGVADSSPATSSFRFDTEVPEIDLTRFEGNATTTAPVFHFESDEELTEFECSVDSAAPVACDSPFHADTLTEGAHTFELHATDTAGNVTTVPSYEFSVDATVPDTTITSGPAEGALLGDIQLSIGFESSESNVTFECRYAASEFEDCESPFEPQNPGDGAKTFEVRATDAAGNVDPMPSVRHFTLDRLSPYSLISRPRHDLAYVNSPVIEFQSEAGSTFLCSLDGENAQTCASPYTLEGLDQGLHTINVTATDAAGNPDWVSETRKFYFDDVAPETAGLAWTGPTNKIIDQPTDGSVIRGPSALFAVQSSESPQRMECNIDGAGFAPCKPQNLLTFADGSHTFGARALDLAGNADPSPWQVTFTVDSTLQASAWRYTYFTAGPGNGDIVSQAKVAFRFESDSHTHRFLCAVDDGAYVACQSPFTADPLTDGVHDVRVRTEDEFGQTDPVPAEVTFEVKTGSSKPETIDLVGPSAPTATTNFAFEFDSSTAGASFSCRIDDSPWRACISGEPFSFPDNLIDGIHRFEVRASSSGIYEQVPASTDFLVDTSMPTVAITGGPQPGSTIGIPAPTFAFDSVDGGVSFECGIDGGGFQSCTSSLVLAPLGDGAHTFAARVVDLAGNVSRARHTAFIVDTGATAMTDQTTPDTMIDGGPQPGSLTNKRVAVFNLSATESGTFECRVDAVAFAACGTRAVTAALADGSHTFYARAIDAAGNVDSSPASRPFTVDATAPSAPTFIHRPGSAVNTHVAEFDVAGEAGASYQCRRDLLDWVACDAHQTLTEVIDGDHQMAVRQTDAAGNVSSPATAEWAVDTMRPYPPAATRIEGVEEGAVRAAWDKVSDSPVDGSGIVGYKVRYCQYRSAASPCLLPGHVTLGYYGHEWTEWQTLSADTTRSAVVRNLRVSESSHVTFEIAAVDRAGNWSDPQLQCPAGPTHCGTWAGVIVADSIASPHTPSVHEFGPFRNLDGQYIDGTETYPITVSANDDDSGIANVSVRPYLPIEASRGSFDATFVDSDGEPLVQSSPECPEVEEPAFSGQKQCPHEYSAEMQADTTVLTEGDHEFESSATDGIGLESSGRDQWSFIVDRTPPDAPSIPVMLALKAATSEAVIRWTVSEDPDIEPGLPGSGTRSTLIRYNQGAGWSEWISRDNESLTIPNSHAGDSVSLELKTLDAVGNVGPERHSSVSIVDPDDESTPDFTGPGVDGTVALSPRLVDADSGYTSPLTGVIVVLTDSHGNVLRLRAGESGVATSSNVPAGNYTVTSIEEPGFVWSSQRFPVHVAAGRKTSQKLNVIHASWWDYDAVREAALCVGIATKRFVALKPLLKLKVNAARAVTLCKKFDSDRTKAETFAARLFTDGAPDDTRQNAFKHSYWNALMVNTILQNDAFEDDAVDIVIHFTKKKEQIVLDDENEQNYKKQSSTMDMHNNRIGYDYINARTNKHNDIFYCNMMRNRISTAKPGKFKDKKHYSFVNGDEIAGLLTYIRGGRVLHRDDYEYSDGKKACGEN